MHAGLDEAVQRRVRCVDNGCHARAAPLRIMYGLEHIDRFTALGNRNDQGALIKEGTAVPEFGSRDKVSLASALGLS